MSLLRNACLAVSVCLLAATISWAKPASEDQLTDNNDRKQHSKDILQLRYQVFPLESNFFEANSHCQRAGLRLATFKTEDEYQALVNEIKKIKHDAESRFWVGGHDLGEEGRWTWLGTGEELTFTLWQEGAPTMGEERDCVELKVSDDEEYKMSDSSCFEDYHYFVCEDPDTVALQEIFQLFRHLIRSL